MAKYKLAISIPTYERPECLTELLDHIVEEANHLNIGIYIFDGSEHNDDTQNACKKYEKYSCFNYIRHSGTVKDRHWEAVTAPDCDYLLLNRDRTVIKPEFFGIILRLLEEKLDLYFLCDCTFRLSNNNRMHFIDSPYELLNNYLWILTLFGSYIVKKDILKATDDNIDAKYYKSFALLAKILKSIPNLKIFKALFIPFDYKFDYYTVNKNIGPMTPEYFFDIWGDDWIQMVDDLPSYYDEYKYKARQSAYLRNIFTILELRKYGTIDLKSVLKNSAIIKKISSIPLIIFIFITLIPKFLVKHCHKIIKPFYNIYDYLRTKINKNIHILKKKINK